MKTKFFFLLLSGLIASGYCLASSFYASDFMRLSDAEKKWGIEKLDSVVFKSGDLSKRAPMAVDILKNNRYVGKDRKVVRDELGDPDSYFFSDTIYAYKIMPFPGEGNEIWHIVFIPDKNLKKVKEVKIHKKCCYK